MRLNTAADRAAYRAAMIPEGALRDVRSRATGEAYSYDQAGKFYAIAFWGSAGRPFFHYSYRTATQRAERLASFFKSVEQSVAFRAERKAKREGFKHSLAVGDVLYSSWGYDQTNIDYYEVTRLIGAKQVEIRMIGAQSEETGWLQGNSVPVPGSYCGEPMLKLVQEGNSVKTRSFGAYAHKLEPLTEIAGKRIYRSQHWTAYA